VIFENTIHTSLTTYQLWWPPTVAILRTGNIGLYKKCLYDNYDKERFSQISLSHYEDCLQYLDGWQKSKRSITICLG